MKNELLTIGPFTVYGYGAMIAVGVCAAYLCTVLRARKHALDPEMVFGLVLWCACGGFLGAKLLFLVTEWRYVLEEPLYYLRSFSDGFVVFGGILGGIIGGFLYCRRKGLPFLAYFDLTMPSIALAQGFGRIGCLLAGCCYGREAHGFFSITFHHSEFAPENIPLFPTQPLCSLLNFLNFFILLKAADQKRPEGQVAALYLIFYSTGRFVMEFFRGDPERGSIGFLSTSQFIALFTLGGGILLFLFAVRRSASRV